MPKYNPKYLDKEEKDLIESYNLVNIKKIKKPTLKEQTSFKNATKDYLQKEIKMNIRIDNIELEKIKIRATSDGLKYSTWVKMILHKYLTGQLVEKR